MVNTAQPCAFLDRDGVIVVPEFRDGRSYAPTTLADFDYFPDTLAALTRLKQAGYLLIVVTNQPDVGNGITSRSVIDKMHYRMQQELPIDHIETCFHAQHANCGCRKPNLGLFINAFKKFNIDQQRSLIIGDRSSDITAGKKLNLTTFFIDYQYNERLDTTPDYTCKNLTECAGIIERDCVA